MRHAQNRIPIVLLAFFALATPVITQANLVCPLCDVEPVATLGVAEVVELVLSTVMYKGVAVLLLGATAVVSLPWVVAGVAVALFLCPPLAQGLVVTFSSLS